MDGWLGYFTVISGTISPNSTLHILNRVVCSDNFFLGELSYACDQIFIFAIKNNYTARENAQIFLVLVKTWLLTFLKFLFLFFLKLTILIILWNLLEESVLRVLVYPRESIQDVASIAAIILVKLKFKHIPEQLVRHSDLRVVDNDVGPTLLRLWQFGSLLIDLLFHSGLDLFELSSAVIDQLILTSCFFVNCSHSENLINQLPNMDARNIVVASQFLRVVCLSTCRRTSDENLDGIEASMSVKLTL